MSEKLKRETPCEASEANPKRGKTRGDEGKSGGWVVESLVHVFSSRCY